MERPSHATLALTAASSSAAEDSLIDALPYIDPLTPDIKKQVEALIEAEMRHSSKRPADYLKDLPPVPPAKFDGHPLLQQEYERVRARQPMPQLDVSRFRLDPPPQSKRGDVTAWRAALDNANAQLEHQLNRIANLELLLKFGPNAWRAQVQLSSAAVKHLEAQLAEARKQTDSLNRERKMQQMAAGTELRRLEDEWANAVRKNLEIEIAAEKLEAEVRMLRAQLPTGHPLAKDGGGSGGAAAGGGGAAAGSGGEGNGVPNGQHAAAAGQDAAADPMDE